MLLASIIIAFSTLAFAMLTLLDRYETAVDKAHVDRRTKRAPKLVYYDAFAERRSQAGGTPPQSPPDNRQAAA